MDRLSACYFCGDAFDASLDEYQVVPERLNPTADSQQTVVVCGDCRRKLDSVVEVIVDAAEAPGEGSGAVDHESEPSQASDTTAEASSDASADDSAKSDVDAALEGGEEMLRSVDDGEDRTEQADSSNGDDDADALGGSGLGDADATPAERGASETTDDASVESGDSGGEADDETGGTTDDKTGSGDADETGGGDADDTGGGDDEGASLTRLEYNKVMRLLQNRELPVKRQGFVNVAANAYELAPRECDRILDVAIQNGLIDEEDGKLVEPAGEE